MITDFKEIESSALKLDKKSKARLADSLLQSIQGKIEPEIEQAWMDEVEKRKAEIQSGEVTPISGEEVLKGARELLKK